MRFCNWNPKQMAEIRAAAREKAKERFDTRRSRRSMRVLCVIARGDVIARKIAWFLEMLSGTNFRSTPVYSERLLRLWIIQVVETYWIKVLAERTKQVALKILFFFFYVELFLYLCFSLFFFFFFFFSNFFFFSLCVFCFFVFFWFWFIFFCFFLFFYILFFFFFFLYCFFSFLLLI